MNRDSQTHRPFSVHRNHLIPVAAVAGVLTQAAWFWDAPKKTPPPATDADIERLERSDPPHLRGQRTAPYGGTNSLVSLLPLRLDRVPTERELRMAGQLGGPLCPTGPAEPLLMRDPSARRRQEQDNLGFGKAINLWNAHRYKEAVAAFGDHRAKFADGPWSAESDLHLGCEAQFTGRWNEAASRFDSILARTRPGEPMYQKAGLRKATLLVERGRIRDALKLFSDLLSTEDSWQRRTYFQGWIRRLNHYQGYLAELHDCGAECVASLLRGRGRSDEARALRTRPGDTEEGMTVAALQALCAQTGLAPLAVNVMGVPLARMPRPFIAHYRDAHFVVVGDALPSGESRVFDPRLGHETLLTEGEILRQFSGIAITLDGRFPPGAALASAEETSMPGGCCGLAKPEDKLGPRCPRSCRGLPGWEVNPANVNLVVMDTPLWHESGLGPEVAFELTYNSLDSHDAGGGIQPVGNKWTLNYTSYATENPGGDVIIVMPDGRRDQYRPNGVGGYLPALELAGMDLRKTADYTFELTLPDGSVYLYGVQVATNSLLLEIRDPHGNAVRVDHDANGSITNVADALGRNFAVAFAGGHVTNISDPFGRNATFAYDALGNLTNQTDMGGQSYGYTYTGGGSNLFLASIRIPTGTTSFFTEPADGLPNGSNAYPPIGGKMWQNSRLTVTDPMGNKEEYYYNGYNRASWHRDRRQMASTLPALSAPKTEFRYAVREGRALLSEIRYADGTKKSFGSFDADGNATFATDEANLTTQFTYNDLGRLTSMSDPRGLLREWQYAPNGMDVTNVIEDGASVARLRYNDRRQIVETRDALDHATAYAYETNGVLLAITNALNEVTVFERDALFRVTNVVHAGQSIASFTYDLKDRVERRTDASGRVRIFTHDGLDRVTQQMWGDGSFEDYIWDCCSIGSVRDRLGRWRFFRHDANKRLVAVEEPDASLAQMGYDPEGNLEWLRDPNGKFTRWEYDARNRPRRRIFADDSTIEYLYEARGLLSAQINARGQTNAFAYDGSGNLTSQTAPGIAPVTFAYDLRGRRTNMVDRIGATAYAHDDAGRLLSVDGPWEDDTITYAYDALNRLTNREINGAAMRWQFDGQGRVEAVDNPLGHFDHQYETAASPLLTRVAAPSGLEILYGYEDVLGDRRLSAITNLVNSAVVSAFGYKYDQADRIKEWAVAQASAATTMIVGLDSLDRLRSVVARDSGTGTLLQDYAYTYDPAGNRLTEKIGSSLSKATHNDLNQITGISRGSTVEFGGSVNEPANVKVNDQPASAWSNNLFSAAVTNLSQGSNTVTITAADGSGNTATNYYRVVVDPTASIALGYDPDGNMLTNVVAGTTHIYFWDSRNRLSRITRNSDVTEFAYDGLDRRVEITELTGTTTNAVRRFLWAGFQIAEERDYANTSRKRYYPQGFQTENGQTETFLHTKDHLGSIREVIDSASTIRATYAYDPWGRVTKISGNIDSDFLFTQHLYHPPSALYLAPYRAYSTSLGRWLSRDPVHELGGLNLYAYVANNPLLWFDPLGLDRFFGRTQCGKRFDFEANSLRELETGLQQNIAGDLIAQGTLRAHGNSVGSDNVNDTPDFLPRLADILDPYVDGESHLTLDGCKTAGERPGMFDQDYGIDRTEGSMARELSKLLPDTDVTGYMGDRTGFRITGGVNGPHFGSAGSATFVNGARVP